MKFNLTINISDADVQAGMVDEWIVSVLGEIAIRIKKNNDKSIPQDCLCGNCWKFHFEDDKDVGQ